MASRATPLLALVAIVVALAVPSGALAQSGPSTPSLGAPEPQETTPPPVTTDSNPNDDGLKGWQTALIFAAGLVLLGGIAVAIVGDARRNAPRRGSVGERRRSGAGPGADELDDVGHRHRQATKQRARQKGRQARASRRRNR
jgi:hypothetical protein